MDIIDLITKHIDVVARNLEVIFTNLLRYHKALFILRTKSYMYYRAIKSTEFKSVNSKHFFFKIVILILVAENI